MANLHKEHFSPTISKNLSFEVDISAQRGQEVRHIGFQLQDQHSSSTESTSLSHQELSAMGKTTSQDQSASSDSGNAHDESYGKHGNDMKAALYLSNPDLSINASQAEINQPIVQFSYAYADPYYSGLYTAYGPHNLMQPQVMAAAAGRVPLPVDLPEDGPIYVNAKQYHGILRRRQTRAKLEAQNKLVKTRKPYLHESRHQHALNRVRGSGGRFLSTKKQHSDSLDPNTSQSASLDSFHLNYGDQSEANKYGGFSVADTSRASGGDAVLQQADGRFSNIPGHMAAPIQAGGALVYNGNRHYASIVR